VMCPALYHLLEHDLRANAFRVCREGKPVSTFPDHAQTCSITMELISLATSSKRSNTFSRCL
jgi:hypothetical protein